jgi:hypothetical protein
MLTHCTIKKKKAENTRPKQKKFVFKKESHTSHPASKASLKKAREIECLATDSDILFCESQ